MMAAGGAVKTAPPETCNLQYSKQCVQVVGLFMAIGFWAVS